MVGIPKELIEQMDTQGSCIYPHLNSLLLTLSLATIIRAKYIHSYTLWKLISFTACCYSELVLILP